MDTLYKNAYDISKAISALVPQGGPVLCRDEMEEWSASEANLFEEALEKYGKDFTDIQQDFVSVSSCSDGLVVTSLLMYTPFCFPLRCNDTLRSQCDTDCFMHITI